MKNMMNELLGLIEEAFVWGAHTDGYFSDKIRQEYESKLSKLGITRGERVMRFRKKPVEVEAIEWTGKNMKEIRKFVGSRAMFQEHVQTKEPILTISTLEGSHLASIGDWIIRGIKGEFYPCKPDIFKQTYDLVETPL